MVGTKVHVEYEIKNPPLIVKPNDEIEGKIIITNGEKKDKKLKKLFIELYDMYSEFVTGTNAEGEPYERWVKRKKEIKQWDIASGEKIKSGEKQEYDFKIKIPNWDRKKGKGKEDDKFNNWRLQLHFNQKTAMVASRGSLKKDATCVLPVKGGRVAPSFGDPKKAKKLKKEAKKVAEGTE